MINKPRVFAANVANLENTDLNKWGFVTPIFSGHVYPDTMAEIDTYRREAKEILRDFDKDVDMLALAGDPALTAMAAIVIADNNPRSRLIVLKYDRKMGGYYPISIPTGDKP